MLFWLAPSIFASLLVVADAAGPRSRRQPKDTYLQVPEVPDPGNYALKDILSSSTLEGLDLNGDGVVDEPEMARALEAKVSDDAMTVWEWIDGNGDKQLDLQELQAVVGESFAGKKVARGQAVTPLAWRLMLLLSEHFSTQDLSRSARLSVSGAQSLVHEMLKSVPLLEERRRLFDAVAGAGVGDSFGAFTEGDLKKWQAKAQRKASKSEAQGSASP